MDKTYGVGIEETKMFFQIFKELTSSMRMLLSLLGHIFSAKH